MHDHIGPPDKSAEATTSFEGTTSGTEKTLTPSWVVGTPIDVKRRSRASIAIRYTKGSETTARIRVMLAKGATAPASSATQTSDTGWFNASKEGTPSAGVTALDKAQWTLTPANFTTDSDRLVLDVPCAGADWLRVDAEYVGGASPGSVFAEAWGGWGQ